MISAVLITKNAGNVLEDCLKSVAFCDECVVVDCGSADNTVAIARAKGAVVYSHPFSDFASQKNFAIQKAKFPWILSIDADERVSDLLREKIKAIVSNSSEAGARAFKVRRLNQLYGAWMRHGASADDFPIRLFRKEFAHFEGLVHEAVSVEGGEKFVGKLAQPLLHHSTATAKEHMAKINHYTSFEAKLFKEQGRTLSSWNMRGRPILKWLQNFFLKRGFQDKMPGFLFSTLSAYHEFISWAKYWEIQEATTQK